MKRFFSIFFALTLCLALCLTTLLSGCSSGQIDRTSELKQAMDNSDSKWSQAFPTGVTTFDQVADYVAGWAGNAELEITKKSDHYIVLTNPATEGQKKTPTVTMALSVDPNKLRDGSPLLSLGMAAILGPTQHGRLRLVITEAAPHTWPGAEAVKGKYLASDHFVYLYKGGSSIVYSAGPLSATGTMTCKAKKKKPSYDNAFEISLSIPSQLDPYTYEKESSLPNPVNVLGDLLASAKSSGRLFEIASFSAEDNGDFLPSSAKAVVVIDDNNVEAFQKRFDSSAEALQKRYDELELELDENGNPLEPLTYTMVPAEMPKKVLKQAATDNIISLMYTLQTGIHLQDENNGAITAASYIRSISTDDGTFRLVMDMRSRDKAAMEEMSGNYLITSGLCDVDYDAGKARRLWSADKDSSLAAWFISAINDEKDDPTRLQSSECDKLYNKNGDLDMIAYRYDKDHRATALEELISYMNSLSSQN